MAIVMVQQRGNVVYVYAERNRLLWSTNGELQGYTGSSVTVKNGNTLYVYDEKRRMIGSRPC